MKERLRFAFKLVVVNILVVLGLLFVINAVSYVILRVLHSARERVAVTIADDPTPVLKRVGERRWELAWAPHSSPTSR